MASKHVADLEAELGVKLLNRTTRRLSLTEAGRQLESTAATIFGLLESTAEEIASQAVRPRGLLRVQAPMSFGQLHLGKIIGDFLAEYPDIEIDLTLEDRHVDLVEAGCDIAIRIRRLDDSSLVVRRLAPARMVLCAAPAYLDRHGVPLHPEDLRRHDCFVYEYLARQNVWSLHRGAERAEVRVSGRLRGNNGDVLVHAAIQGQGITLAPTFIAWQALRAGSLVPILTDWSVVEPEIFAVMPPGRIDVLKVRVFLDHLVRAIGQAPYWDEGLPISP